MVMELLITGAEKLGLQLNTGQIEKFQNYFDKLIEWNRKFNLTAITDYTEVQLKHFLDSLTISLVWKPSDTDFVLDVGSGAGFPALPLKIAFPGFRLVLMEAVGKKTVFLAQIIRELGLDNVEIVKGRAEEFGRDIRYREKFNVVLGRALAKMPSLVEMTLPFCKIGGIIISPKKGEFLEELRDAQRAIDLLGGKMRSPFKVELTEFTDKRYLIVIDKISQTPSTYPRRPGIPQKRPLL